MLINKSIYIPVHFTIVTRKNLESKQVKEKSIEEYLELAKAAVKKLDKYIKDFRTSYEQQFDPDQGNVEEEEHLEAVRTKTKSSLFKSSFFPDTEICAWCDETVSGSCVSCLCSKNVNVTSAGADMSGRDKPGDVSLNFFCLTD